METWVTMLCVLIILILFFLIKYEFRKHCMETMNLSEEQCKEDSNGSERDKPYREGGDGRNWSCINGQWILVWPRPRHRLNKFNDLRHRRHRRRKLRVEKTDLEPIPEEVENELQTESEPEPELEPQPKPTGPCRRGTSWWVSALCLDDLDNEQEHPSTRVHNVQRGHELLLSRDSRRPGGFKNMFLESFRCCIGHGPVD